MADARIDTLCDAFGIALSYRDADGVAQDATDAGKRHALAALGIPASSDAEIGDSLSRAEERHRRPVPELIIVAAGRAASIAHRAPEHGHFQWVVETEDGATLDGGASDASPGTIALPALPAGYHRLQLSTANGRYSATVLATPDRCYLPDAFAGDDRAWGVTAQVYSLRGRHDLGVGTYADVATLATAVGRRGGAFLGLSPVHALFGADSSKFSPYSPSSRLFLQTSLVAPHAVPGFDAITPDLAGHDGALIDYPTAFAHQRRALDAIWASTRDSSTAAMSAFRSAGGAGLENHATFEALSEHFKAQGLHWVGEWPAAYRSVQSPDVAAFRREHAERVAFHVWLQFLADQQLGQAASAARDSRMAIGLYRDLAVGADRGGSEVWCARDRFISTLSVGAPPDPLGPSGQDWGLPPLHPLALATSGLAAFRDLVSANMRHAGAIRIDHAFQLQRLFCLPVGGMAKDGVYLSYPLDALLAALKIESHRAKCVVIGEDLGTAPAGFSEAIMDAGMLSYRLLPFERGEGGTFKAPWAYPRRALAALSTHDLPTFAGWWRGLDIDVRETLGVFDIARARNERGGRLHDRRLLAEALMTEGFDADPQSLEHPPEIAALRYLARTPSMLAAVQLEDVLREQQQANLPGPDCGHPNWRRRSSVPVDAIEAHPGLDRVAAAFATERRSHTYVARNVPQATYRLQLHAGFTFDDAVAVVPYIARLGVTHVYTSPILMAAPGSMHGYDCVDPTRLNPELGGEHAFHRFSDALRAHGLMLIVDVVPNHVGVGGKHNPWWLDLLEWGRLSAHARSFDIDWQKPGSDGKIIVPFLGEPFEDLLAKRHINLGFEADIGRFAVWFADNCHPVSPFDYAALLSRAHPHDEASVTALRALVAAFRDLRTWERDNPRAIVARGAALKRALATACSENEALRRAIEQSTAEMPQDALRRLCARQTWRMVVWTEANAKVNYRRFFDITSLAGVRVENPDVFDTAHRVILDLVEAGRIQGLRIDHVDGLADPAGYLARLQERVGPGFYVLIEKILEPGESLPPWPIAGTTGYDALHTLDGLFFAQESLPALDRLSSVVSGNSPDRDTALFDIKTELVEKTFASEFVSLLADVETDTGLAREQLRQPLSAMLAVFPIYRTYGARGGLSQRDHAILDGVARSAKARIPAEHHPGVDAIVEALNENDPGRRSLRRFQQLTGPLMAKSFEDTLFYRDTRFIAANEVGCGPEHPGIDASAFHDVNAERLASWPGAMIATATHDTKRGEDARGRLLAASHDMPAWTTALESFLKCDGSAALAPADVYFLFQALVAAAPLTAEEGERTSFLDRAQQFAQKFLREGKQRSSWTAPDADYERAVRDFVARCAAPDGLLFNALAPFVQRIAIAGAKVGVARTVLKCTVPGVPDVYQGTELTDLAFVDPDNRRSVNYGEREWLLGKEVDPRDEQALLAGRVKFFVLHQLLQARRAEPRIWRGAYTPLDTGDEQAAVAYLRGEGRESLLVVAARAFPPVSQPNSWQFALPPGEWQNLFDGRTFEGDATVSGDVVLGAWPAVVMRRH